jgi:murein DD-endopeptidase MepM/ murein hydrolase activator NlpD
VAPPPATYSELTPGQWLEINQYLQSNNGRYRLYQQGDGNLVLYDEGQGHKALWSSGTNGRPGAHTVMQADGNLVVYSGATGVWSTHTNGWTGARLSLQDDGNLVIYSGSTAVWDRHAGLLRNPPTASGSMARPLTSYTVTQEYGNGHTGIDLAANSGTPVYAAADGVVYFEGYGTSDRAGKRSDWMGTEAGISILIQHDGLGVYTGYAHLSDTVINQGQTVTKGQLIGHVGCTGSCTGPHLHFEVLPAPLNGSVGILGRLNPRNYLSL